MAGIKPLSEQTLMNNYVFSMVMREPRRIKPLLEHILGKKIKTIRMVEPEKTMKEKFESKGIRLDLYVEDADGVVYDVEVQTTDQKNLPRRMRYYQGMLDITFFPAGADYNLMRKSYVIFICNFDPYGEGLYIYTFQNRCDQNYEVLLGDDAVKVVVNTKGTKGDISPELKEAIIYLDREEVTGPYSKELDDAVNELKSNEERGQEYMMLMTYGAEQKAAGKYIDKVEFIRNWNSDGQLFPKDVAAQSIRIALPIFDGVLNLIHDHPDWDDEMIADQASWR
jgi:predicted transposase/invertase (TIGR01784 family)